MILMELSTFIYPPEVMKTFDFARCVFQRLLARWQKKNKKHELLNSVVCRLPGSIPLLKNYSTCSSATKQPEVRKQKQYQ